MSNTAAMWDEKYKSDVYYYGTVPNAFLRLAASGLNVGARVLSIGEGEGRNAVYLAKYGCAVTAVDASIVGRDKALRLAASCGVEFEYRVMDLANGFEQLGGDWDAIVSIWCHLPTILREQLHKWTPRALAVGGVYIFEGYTPKQLEFGTGGPKEVSLLCAAEDICRELLENGTTDEQKIPVTFEILQTVERDVQEGLGHSGRSATLQILMRRP